MRQDHCYSVPLDLETLRTVQSSQLYCWLQCTDVSFAARDTPYPAQTSNRIPRCFSVHDEHQRDSTICHTLRRIFQEVSKGQWKRAGKRKARLLSDREHLSPLSQPKKFTHVSRSHFRGKPVDDSLRPILGLLRPTEAGLSLLPELRNNVAVQLSEHCPIVRHES